MSTHSIGHWLLPILHHMDIFQVCLSKSHAIYSILIHMWEIITIVHGWDVHGKLALLILGTNLGEMFPWTRMFINRYMRTERMRPIDICTWNKYGTRLLPMRRLNILGYGQWSTKYICTRKSSFLRNYKKCILTLIRAHLNLLGTFKRIWYIDIQALDQVCTKTLKLGQVTDRQKVMHMSSPCISTGGLKMRRHNSYAFSRGNHLKIHYDSESMYRIACYHLCILSIYDINNPRHLFAQHNLISFYSCQCILLIHGRMGIKLLSDAFS